MSSNWLQLAQEAIKIPGLLVEVYGDLARPGVRQVGKALETVIGLGNTVLWPVAWANERSRIALERNLERYRQALEYVSEEKIISVAPEIGVPIAEKLAYSQDEKLTDLYVRLLASASSSDTVADAHPSFVNVIANLSPDEARLIEHFRAVADVPFIAAQAEMLGSGLRSVLMEPKIPENYLAGLAFPQNVDAYISNLQGLGLVTIRGDVWQASEATYEQMENSMRPRLEEIMNSVSKFAGRNLVFDRGLIESTSFGRQFIRACNAREI